VDRACPAPRMMLEIQLTTDPANLKERVYSCMRRCARFFAKAHSYFAIFS
jgi:hypothetical protein